MNPAVRRRESLLATTTAASTPAASEVSSETQSTTQPQTSPDSAIPSPTRSQEIAQSVLSGSGTTTALPNSANASPDMTTLAAALGSGAGNQGNPIYVTVADRELFHHLVRELDHRLTNFPIAKATTIMRFVRFIVFTAVASFCKHVSCFILSGG